MYYQKARSLISDLLTRIVGVPATVTAQSASKRQKLGGCYGMLSLPQGLAGIAAPGAASTDVATADPLEQLYAYEKEAVRASQSPPEGYNLFQWWKSAVSKGAYEHLGQIARVLLGVRPTSVDPERNFSDASNIISAKRSRLSPAMAELLLMIKSNCDLISDPNEVSQLSRSQVQSVMPQLFGDESDDFVDAADTSDDSDSDDIDSD